MPFETELNRMFKETGHQNAIFPVPKSMFEAEEKMLKDLKNVRDCYVTD
jgi:hypothetical protein